MESALNFAGTSALDPAGDGGSVSDSAALASRNMSSTNKEDHVKWTPYWTGSTRQARSSSNVSYDSTGWRRAGQILLEDHSEETHDLSQGCWAKSAVIDDYVLISGASGMGAYVVWHCTVETLKGGNLVIRKRYAKRFNHRFNPQHTHVRSDTPSSINCEWI